MMTSPRQSPPFLCALAVCVAGLLLALPATAGAAGYLPIDAWGSEATAPFSFLRPKGICVDGDGFVYAAEYRTCRIHKFTADGLLLASWGRSGSGPGEFLDPSRLAAGPDDSIYVTDTANNRIQRFTSDGKLLDVWGSYGTRPGQFRWPRGIDVGPDGRVYVTDQHNQRLQIFTADGRLLRVWGRKGYAPGRFIAPKDVAVGPDGTVFIIDAATHRVQVFTAGGRLLDWWGSLGTAPGKLNGPRGLEVDAEGDVLVADSDNDRLQEFGPDGALLRVWSCLGALPGLTRGPRDIAMLPDSTFVVSDSFNARVQRFALVASDDDTPPVTTSDAPSGWQTRPVTITLAASDAGGGVLRTYARVGREADFELYAEPLALTTDGVRRVQYVSVDAAGNQERMRTRTVMIDRAAPTVRPAPLVVPTSPAGRTVSLACTVADATSPRCRLTLIVRRDGVQIAHRSFGWRRVARDGRRFELEFTAPAAPGRYTLVLRARDLAGNAGQSTGALHVR